MTSALTHDVPDFEEATSPEPDHADAPPDEFFDDERETDPELIDGFGSSEVFRAL